MGIMTRNDTRGDEIHVQVVSVINDGIMPRWVPGDERGKLVYVICTVIARRAEREGQNLRCMARTQGMT